MLAIPFALSIGRWLLGRVTGTRLEASMGRAVASPWFGAAVAAGIVVAGALVLWSAMAVHDHRVAARARDAEHARQVEASRALGRRLGEVSETQAAVVVTKQRETAAAAELVVREILMPPLTVNVEHAAAPTAQGCPADYTPRELQRLNSIRIGAPK